MSRESIDSTHRQTLMNKFHAALVVVTMILAAAGAAAQGVKVGYVNPLRIEKESAPAQRAIASLNEEFEPRNQQIQALQREITAGRERLGSEGPTMPPAERQALERELAAMMRKSDQMVLAAKEDYDLRRREVGIRLLDEFNAAIKSIAEKGKYDLIVQDAMFARAGIDITDQVLKEIARRSGGR